MLQWSKLDKEGFRLDGKDLPIWEIFHSQWSWFQLFESSNLAYTAKWKLKQILHGFRPRLFESWPCSDQDTLHVECWGWNSLNEPTTTLTCSRQWTASFSWFPSDQSTLLIPQVVQETIEPNARIVFRANTQDDPHKRKPDISKAKELLGWEPTIPLRKGLPLMVSDFRTRIFGDHKGGLRGWSWTIFICNPFLLAAAFPSESLICSSNLLAWLSSLEPWHWHLFFSTTFHLGHSVIFIFPFVLTDFLYHHLQTSRY